MAGELDFKRPARNRDVPMITKGANWPETACRPRPNQTRWLARRLVQPWIDRSLSRPGEIGPDVPRTHSGLALDYPLCCWQ